MTLYFDTKVQFLDSDAISTVSCWHSTENLFAVGSFSQDKGGSVTIFDDSVNHKLFINKINFIYIYLNILINIIIQKIFLKNKGRTTSKCHISSSSCTASNCIMLASRKKISDSRLGKW